MYAQWDAEEKLAKSGWSTTFSAFTPLVSPGGRPLASG